MKNLKITSILIISLLLVMPLLAQEDSETAEDIGFSFTVEKQVKTAPVRNQYRSGTCWSFSANSFLEAELLRMGKEEVDLSDMWPVRHSYYDKAIKYVRMHGTINFTSGGAFHDVFNVYKKYGIVPEEEYPGLKYGEDNHVHGELDNVLKSFVDAVKENKNKKLSTAWKEALNGLLDAYLGVRPKEFRYEGKNFTPKSFADHLGLNFDDYVGITSYTHHPFYEEFVLEIPDNWAWGKSFNVSMEEMMDIIDYALSNDYPVCWGADVSEKGFSWTNGVAIVPETDRPNLDGLEQARWEKMSAREKDKLLYSFEKPVPEKVITQEMRQEAFDNYETTDDHGMVIVGIAKDQFNATYYLVQNSWDTNNVYDGFFYASKAFVKYKTMNIIVHKDALPKSVRKKMN